MLSDPISLLAILCLIVTAGIFLESRPKWTQFGVLLVIFVPASLSALGIIPRSAELYSLVANYFVPLSIPLLLFGANLREVLRQARPLFFAFVLAVLVTLSAASIGIFGLGLSPLAKEWAAISTAGFVGGSANIIAVADAFERTSSAEMAIVASSVFLVALPFLAVLLSIPSIGPIWRLIAKHDAGPLPEASEPHSSRTETITVLSLSTAISLSAAIVALGNAAVLATGVSPLRYIVITILSLMVATFLPSSRSALAGHFHLGQILIYTFFATLGAQINLTLLNGLGFEIAGYVAFVVSTHLVAMALLGRVFKISGPVLLIASNACILGPATAGAMAAARGWHGLIAPGILCGVLGYAIANFLGISLAALVIG